MADSVRDQLLRLSRQLGAPERDCAILGEGNVSAVIGAGAAFLVKASGTQLGLLEPGQLVECDAAMCRAYVDGPGLSDGAVDDALRDVKVDPSNDLRPSVETFMHAALLGLDGVSFVGHTHPTAVNALTCGEHFEKLTERVFPDQVVVCGPSSALVPYVDPGLPLARAVRDAAVEYQRRFDETPRTIYLKSHGFIALGASAEQVLQITDMAVKAARVLAGALAIGRPEFLSDKQVARIAGRGDEHYRQRVLAGAGGRTL